MSKSARPTRSCRKWKVTTSHLTMPSLIRRCAGGHTHELELKLLLSKTVHNWNIAVNPLAAKNLSGANPWEFGYAIGASRPLGLKASAQRCSFCAENFTVGVEMYGGLGTTSSFGLRATSHYLALV